MTISTRRMAPLVVDAAATAGTCVPATGGTPAAAACHPAYLCLARRAFDPVAAPLLGDDGTALGTLDRFSARDERGQQRSRAFVSLARVTTRCGLCSAVLLAAYAFVYGLENYCLCFLHLK